MINQRSCFERACAALSSVETLAISAPQAMVFASDFLRIDDWKIVGEGEQGSSAALALLGCLDWASKNGFDYIVTTPVDTPFLPADYAAILERKYQENGCADIPIVCGSAGQLHGLHALWPCRALEVVKPLILETGERKIRRIHQALGSETIEFNTASYDPFLNMNTPQDLETMQALATKMGI